MISKVPTKILRRTLGRYGLEVVRTPTTFQPRENTRTSGLIVELLGVPGVGKVLLREAIEKHLAGSWNTNIWSLNKVRPPRPELRDPSMMESNLEIMRRHIVRIQEQHRDPRLGYATVTASARLLGLHDRMRETSPTSAGWFVYEGVFHHFADEILSALHDGHYGSGRFHEAFGRERGIVHLTASTDSIVARLRERDSDDVVWNHARIWGSDLEGFVRSAVRTRAQLAEALREMGYWVIEVSCDDASEIDPEAVTSWAHAALEHFGRGTD